MNKSGSHSVVSSSRKTGFTIVELLVVVAILMTLAALIFSVSKKAFASADRVTCVNIMRQYGTATAGYLSDHNNMMPAIGVNQQRPCYRREGDYHIFGKLFPYFGLERQPKWAPLPDNLVCPAWRKRFPDWKAGGTGRAAGSVCGMNQDQRVNGRRIYGTQKNATDQYGPMSYASVANGTEKSPLSSILFLSDGHHPTEKTEPVHGNMRNHLFLDFHVESLPVGQIEGGISP